MRLDIHHLKTFYHLCLTKSYTATAKKINLTQSAVSHSIKKLEGSIEVKLVDKKGKEFSLTKEGKLLFNTCEELFTKIKDVEEELRSETFNETIDITIGAPVEFGTTILISSIADFIKENSNFHLNFSLHHKLFDKLLKNEIDLIIDCKGHYDQSIESIFLCDEPYSIVGSPAYCKEHGLNTVKDFPKAQILSCDNEGIWWERFLNSPSIGKNINLGKVITINHIKGLINGVVNNLGITLVPRYTVTRELERGFLIEIFPEVDLRVDKFKIFIKKENLRLNKYQHLIEYLKNRFTTFD